MQRLSLTTALIVVALSGCIHRSPNERILAAFSRDGGGPLFLGDPAPEYVGFADPVSARVLGGAVRGGKYRVPPAGQPLYCPGVAGSGNKGYLLGVHVYTVRGDTAFATLAQDCNPSAACPRGELCGSMGTLRRMTDYLLVRRGGKWAIAKVVSGGVTISS
jgi:hypothetical protein